MVNRTLAKNGRKNKNIIVVMLICLLFLTIALLPNNSWAFSSATADFVGIGVFDVLRFGNNVEASGSAISRAGASSQRAEFGDVYIQISLNEFIPQLFLSCPNGTHISEVTILFGGEPYSIKLYDVIVSSFDWSELQGNDSALGIGLNYGKIEWTYGGETTGWDLEANKKVKIMP